MLGLQGYRDGEVDVGEQADGSPEVRWLKIYDASGHTERLFGHSDSVQFALAPESQGEADERRPAGAALI